MTEAGTIPLEQAAEAESVIGFSASDSRGFVRGTIDQLLSRTSVRLGLAWIGVMLLGAVFAPVLANSHPILMKQNDRWSSPLLAHLSSGDVILQILFWSGILLVLTRKSVPVVRQAILISAIILCLLASLLVRPAAVVVYDTYRTGLNAGSIQKTIFAAIPYSPADHLRDHPELRLTGPTREHLLGTTSDSADLLSNMIYATRIAISIGFISTGIAVVIGCALGGVMGYFGGWVDLIGMRLAEIFSAIPTLLLLLCFIAVFPPNLYVMMAIIGFTNWVGYATFVRAEFLSLRDRDFVHAARAAGIPTSSILFRHMLPNGISPVLVSASFGVAGAILIESTLSFLGVGLVGEASWGGLLNQAVGEGGGFSWWIALYPGLAIFLTVFSYNLIGEALRDALDPKLLKR